MRALLGRSKRVQRLEVTPEAAFNRLDALLLRPRI